MISIKDQENLNQKIVLLAAHSGQKESDLWLR